MTDDDVTAKPQTIGTPSLREYLLTASYAEDEEDEFDLALRDVREGRLTVFSPRPVGLDD